MRTEEEKCHTKTMMSRKSDRPLNETNTQHVSLRQNVEEREQGKGLKVV